MPRRIWSRLPHAPSFHRPVPQHDAPPVKTARRDLVELRPEGLYCPAGDFHIDPWRPVPRAVITHGHGDHARGGMGEYHCVRESLPILQWRLGAQRYRVVEYGEPFDLGETRVAGYTVELFYP